MIIDNTSRVLIRLSNFDELTTPAISETQSSKASSSVVKYNSRSESYEEAIGSRMARGTQSSINESERGGSVNENEFK